MPATNDAGIAGFEARCRLSCEQFVWRMHHWCKGICAYVASRHAVVGLARSVALDYADRGLRVNAVFPGFPGI
ncbi:MAG: SDR family oxidoreductase [Verrucomicrobia bacterium]|nr:SDR family oxidoreductase [Verrucomicrobiota bacterium]